MYEKTFSTDPSRASAPPSLRPVVMGHRHMISAGHYLAAEAGFRVLEAGGNAIDAGVAAGIALGVVESELVNFAGVAPIMIRLAKTKEVVTIDGLGIWPKTISIDPFVTEHGGTIPPGILRTIVPAAPDAWLTALERFGTMSFGEVAADAIRFARDGFAMHALMAELIRENADGYRRWAANAAIYLPGGRPPGIGERFVQKDLARTLQHMADEEKRAARRGGRKRGLKAAREAFYRGDIAKAITDFQRRNGGFLTMADMAGFRVEIGTPVRYRFRGTDVYACGPWCQGPVLLQMLSILDGIDLAALGHNSVEYVHILAEAMKLAFADRERHYADPRFARVPIAALLSSRYAATRRGLIRALEAWTEMPPAGDPMGRGDRAKTAAPRAQGGEPMVLDTSYVAVVDRHGNAFSATPSDSSWHVPVVPGTGLAPSGRGYQSWATRGHPQAIAAGRRPRLTPNPALAVREGRLVMPFGTPGGDVQCQAMLQAFLNVVVFGMDLQQAVEAPRFATFSFPNSFEPHTYYPGRLNLERALGSERGDRLAALGHKVEWWPERTWRAGGMCMVSKDEKTGLLSGGADPRRASYAVGW